jgi:DNA-binding transcriptional LysR family regulator
MNLQGFDVRHLVVLDMLFTERHVGRAAQRLSLSQPAVSNALGWLRKYFDDPLLVRGGGALRLTPFAERLRDPVRRLLVDIRTVATERPTFDPATSTHRFRIVMSEYVAALILSPLLQLAAEAAPGARIDILRIDGDVNEFKRGEVDLIVLPRERLLSHDSFEILFDDRWICVGCAEAQAGRDVLTHADYLAARHVIPDQPQSLTSELEALGITRDIAAKVPQALLPRALIGTPWIATVPEGFIEQSPYRPALRIFEAPFPARPLRIAQQWHSESDDDAATSWLRDILRQAAAQTGLPSGG